MTKNILVAYATQAGSTAEVAQAIGKTLSETGAQVDVHQVKTVTDLALYDSVVMGSAIHGGKWLPEAMRFLQAHQAELSRKPFAAFLVCITMGSPNPAYRAGVGEWLAPVRAVVRPIKEGLFAGNLDFAKLPLNKDTIGLRIATSLKLLPRGDCRDWNAIRTWANDLKPLVA